MRRGSMAHGEGPASVAGMGEAKGQWQELCNGGGGQQVNRRTG
jgi:hypothetical protein